MDHTKDDVDAAAAGFLARRDHSTGELRAKLLKRGFDRTLIDEVLASYAERGWLNDEAFAAHQADVLARKAWGPLQIHAKLTQHGVDRAAAQRAVEGLDVDWEQSARDRLAGRLRLRDAAKAYRHLVQRGFPNALARRVAFEQGHTADDSEEE